MLQHNIIYFCDGIWFGGMIPYVQQEPVYIKILPYLGRISYSETKYIIIDLTYWLIRSIILIYFFHTIFRITCFCLRQIARVDVAQVLPY